MRGIVLAGGNGTRLSPLTKVISKQLLPVYDKPMIYYPLQTLKSMGVTEVAIITKSCDREQFHNLLGDGSSHGMEFRYFTQDEPRGIAEAFQICRSFIGEDDVALILGDNIFITDSIPTPVANTVYGYKVKDPNQYGVARLNSYDELIGVVEKPIEWVSDIAIVGLYVFDSTCVQKADKISVSRRGELEIADVINQYILEDSINIEILPSSAAWFDCGTIKDLNDCSNLIRALRERTNIKLGL